MTALLFLLFTFAFIYIGKIYLLLLGLLSVLIEILIWKLPKGKALLATQAFLIIAIVCYLVYLKYGRIIEILACGISASFYIFYFLNTLLRNENMHKNEAAMKAANRGKSILRMLLRR